MDAPSGRSGRRQFLTRACAATALIAAHRTFAGTAGAFAPAADATGDKGPLITSLTLLTAAPLAKMKEFYRDSLGLRVLAERAGRLTIGAGETALTFESADAGAGQPFYHFAFNIPENKIRAARDWQRERTPLLPIPARLRDRAYPDDVVDYRHWDAHSVFFFDPAGNVVEYIARHTLKNDAPGAFSSKDILYASEIGLVVDDVPAAAAKLQEFAGLDQYRDGSAQFMAIGDERGLLLAMKRGRVISFDSPQKKAVTVFRTAATVRGSKAAKLAFPGFPYEVTTRS
jgi:catechol-2,3-dioxygenase